MASNFNTDELVEEAEEMEIVDEAITTNPEYKKSQTLVDIANNTFRELCKTLENEQVKLVELEERRKKLQEEMLRLKQEIEDEKESYRLNMVDSLTDNLNALNSDGDGGETVHEFIERQKAALQKLNIDTSALQLDTESSTNVIASTTTIDRQQPISNLNVNEKESSDSSCSQDV